MGAMVEGPSESSAMNRLIDHLGQLPGIGRRSAERIAFHLLKRPEEEVTALGEAIVNMKRSTRHCSRCFNLAERDPCTICGDPRRDPALLLVVEQPSDVAIMESTGLYHGLYHVLMGRLAPLEGIGPEELNVKALLRRLDDSGERTPIREVILALNPTLEGDGTALYLAELIEARGVKLTRLARGLPTGSHLERVGKAVLADALAGRHGISASRPD